MYLHVPDLSKRPRPLASSVVCVPLRFSGRLVARHSVRWTETLPAPSPPLLQRRVSRSAAQLPSPLPPHASQPCRALHPASSLRGRGRPFPPTSFCSSCWRCVVWMDGVRHWCVWCRRCAALAIARSSLRSPAQGLHRSSAISRGALAPAAAFLHTSSSSRGPLSDSRLSVRLPEEATTFRAHSCSSSRCPCLAAGRFSFRLA